MIQFYTIFIISIGYPNKPIINCATYDLQFLYPTEIIKIFYIIPCVLKMVSNEYSVT